MVLQQTSHVRAAQPLGFQSSAWKHKTKMQCVRVSGCQPASLKATLLGSEFASVHALGVNMSFPSQKYVIVVVFCVCFMPFFVCLNESWQLFIQPILHLF